MYFFEDHTADVLLIVKSVSFLDFFNDLLAGLFDLFSISNEERNYTKKKYIKFDVLYDDYEELVFNFISKYIYFVDTKRLVLEKVIYYDIGNKKIFFKSRGLVFSNIRSYIKAPTYHNLDVKMDFDSNYFYCKVVLDV